MLSIFSFIAKLALGALIGWLASYFMGDKTSSLVQNIVLGIVGSMVGGLLAGLLGISAATFSIGGVAISVAGACVCVWIARKISH